MQKCIKMYDAYIPSSINNHVDLLNIWVKRFFHVQFPSYKSPISENFVALTDLELYIFENKPSG